MAITLTVLTRVHAATTSTQVAAGPSTQVSEVSTLTSTPNRASSQMKDLTSIEIKKIRPSASTRRTKSALTKMKNSGSTHLMVKITAIVKITRITRVCTLDMWPNIHNIHGLEQSSPPVCTPHPFAFIAQIIVTPIHSPISIRWQFQWVPRVYGYSQAYASFDYSQPILQSQYNSFQGHNEYVVQSTEGDCTSFNLNA